MTEAEIQEELSPMEAFLGSSRDELEQVRKEHKEIGMLVEQSQGEVEKLAQRNASIAATLKQIESNFDTVPREDIRNTYEAAQDAQQRLFTMRGQLEKLESDQETLQRYAEFIQSTVNLLEGRSPDEVTELESGTATVIEQIIDAQEEERRKISRQIHDGPAQSLSNFILQAEIAMRFFDTDQDKAREELNNLKASATSTFSKIRDYIFDLRPMMLDDLGIVPTIRRYCEAFQEKTGLELNVVVTGTERRLEAHREVLIFRTVQALLQNVRDYAQATQVKIMVDLDDTQVRATVEDNGKGFDVEPIMQEESASHGIRVSKDRLEQVGGTFEIESKLGEGTRVTFSVPTGEV
ncbi:MAG: sensor histidine kinase [Chloroflexi bacterium]|nr:sensor histidine kinase [Chloroflexota bacterium]